MNLFPESLNREKSQDDSSVQNTMQKVFVCFNGQSFMSTGFHRKQLRRKVRLRIFFQSKGFRNVTVLLTCMCNTTGTCWSMTGHYKICRSDNHLQPLPYWHLAQLDLSGVPAIEMLCKKIHVFADFFFSSLEQRTYLIQYSKMIFFITGNFSEVGEITVQDILSLGSFHL